MPQPKETIVKEIEEKLKRARGVVLTDFKGLSVHELNELRKRLREDEIEYKVFKNTLIRMAVKKCNLGELEKYLQGPTALTFGYGDPLLVTKKVMDFAKEYKALGVKGGVLDEEVVDGSHIKKLAELPSKEELVAMVIGGFKSPFYRLVGSLKTPFASLVVTLGRVAEERAQAEG